MSIRSAVFGLLQPESGGGDPAKPVLGVRFEEDVFALWVQVNGRENVVLLKRDIFEAGILSSRSRRCSARSDTDNSEVVLRLCIRRFRREFLSDVGNNVST